jgi:hypothetical protein
VGLICCFLGILLLLGLRLPKSVDLFRWRSSNLGRKSEVFLGGVGSRSCPGGFFDFIRPLARWVGADSDWGLRSS